MIKQVEHQEVLLLLQKQNRGDLRRFIGDCWESLEVEEEMKNAELCVEKLISLYPEKKISTKYINVPEISEEDCRMLY